MHEVTGAAAAAEQRHMLGTKLSCALQSFDSWPSQKGSSPQEKQHSLAFLYIISCTQSAETA
jgi:hypothetical protein